MNVIVGSCCMLTTSISNGELQTHRLHFHIWNGTSKQPQLKTGSHYQQDYYLIMDTI